MKFISRDYASRDEPPGTPRPIIDDMVWPVVDAFFKEMDSSDTSWSLAMKAIYLLLDVLFLKIENLLQK
jgi:hypothetical protein